MFLDATGNRPYDLHITTPAIWTSANSHFKYRHRVNLELDFDATRPGFLTTARVSDPDFGGAIGAATVLGFHDGLPERAMRMLTERDCHYCWSRKYFTRGQYAMFPTLTM